MKRRPVPVRVEVHRILSRVLDGEASSSHLLDRLRTRDARDRALATELVFGVLRRLAALDHHIERLASRPPSGIDPPLRNVLRLGLYQLRYLEGVAPHAVVDQSVRLARQVSGHRAAGFANAVLRAFLRQGDAGLEPGPCDDLVAYLCVTQSCPRWLVERWLERYGPDAARRLIEAQNEPPRAALSPNTQRISAAGLRERLNREGYQTSPSTLVPQGVVARPGRVTHSAVVREGLAWVQDEAAQLVVALVGASPGSRVYDACAAPGGKTQGLALAVGEEGLVVAGDARPERLPMLARNLDRLGLTRVAVLATDAARPGLAKGFDAVLVDAPCSGTGTLRRNPEIRWRLQPAGLERLAETQQRLLGSAAALVRPGGRLVYATCSVEPEENDRVVAGFLSSVAGFRLCDATDHLPHAARGLVGADGVLRTWPLEPEIDGFTAFVLERDSS